MNFPIPLSSCILTFEVLSLLALPLVLLASRRYARLKAVAKCWGALLAAAVLLQAFARHKRTYTYSMHWTLQAPEEIRTEIQPASSGTPKQAVVVFSRPPLTEETPEKHTCYQVIFSDALAKRLQQLHRDDVEVQYDITFRFDSPIFISSPWLKGDDPNKVIGEMGFMSQGHEPPDILASPVRGSFAEIIVVPYFPPSFQ